MPRHTGHRSTATKATKAELQLAKARRADWQAAVPRQAVMFVGHWPTALLLLGCTAQPAFRHSQGDYSEVRGEGRRSTATACVEVPSAPCQPAPPPTAKQLHYEGVPKAIHTSGNSMAALHGCSYSQPASPHQAGSPTFSAATYVKLSEQGVSPPGQTPRPAKFWQPIPTPVPTNQRHLYCLAPPFATSEPARQRHLCLTFHPLPSDRAHLCSQTSKVTSLS